MLRIASMPTVWASVPMHAPTTTSLRRSRFLIAALISLAGQQRVLALDDLDLVEVDEVGDRAVDDEEGEVRPHRLRVHQQRGLHAHLGGELERGALGALVVRQRQGERQLHHAVAGGVAVGAHDRRRESATTWSSGGPFLEQARSPGCRSPSALATTPSRPLPWSAGASSSPKVPSAMAASSGCGCAVPRSVSRRWPRAGRRPRRAPGGRGSGCSPSCGGWKSSVSPPAALST